MVRLDPPEAYLGPRPEPAAAGGPEYYRRPPWRSLYADRFESLLVEITADDGTTGWGEALAPVAPEVPAAIVERLLAPFLQGADPRKVRPLWTELCGLMRERGHLVGHQADALAAVDIALWANDLATFDAVATAHPDLKIAIDAHWSYDLAHAMRLARSLDERKAAWFLEAPMAPEDLPAHRELAAAAVTPIAVGETMRNRYEFLAWLSARAVDLCQPDVGRTGITELVAIAEIASAHHIPVAPHHSVGLGVALAAGLHVCAAIEAMPAFEFQPGTMAVANDSTAVTVRR